MDAKSPADQQDRRKANKRLALVLGLIALAFYLLMVVFKPMTGS